MRGLGHALSMDEAVWARHANPWSVWTRLPILPLAALAIWARVWIGPWCLLPLAAIAVWAWVNPRAFPPPERTASWASRAVLGEKLWLARARRPVPEVHHRAAQRLAAAAALGLLPLGLGLWVLEPWLVGMGLALTMSAKLLFLDRMVRIHDARHRR